MLYFGYGSNLCGLDPIRRARVGPAFLPDRRLAFTHRSTTRGGGVLDVPQARGRAVSGVLFRAPSDEAIATLDRKEGEGHAYRRIETVALTEDGAEEPAFAYEIDPVRRESFVAPTPAYVDVVRRGYDAYGLATEPLDSAARSASHAGPIDGLFVYGTLRRGEERHPSIASLGASGGETALAAGTLLDLGPYPGLIVDGRKASVAGELYAAPDPDALFAELDAIEVFRGFGVPGSLFRRAIVRVRGADLGSTLAWAYIYAGSRTGSRVIASGDWRDRRRP